MAHRRKKEAFNVHESGMDMALTMFGILLILMAVMMMEARQQSAKAVAARTKADALSGQLADALSTLQQTKRQLRENQADKQAVEKAKEALAQAREQADQVQDLQQALAAASQDQSETETLRREVQRLQAELKKGIPPLPESYVDQARQSFGLGKHDLDLFIDGLRHLPGKDLHLVVDATGSMHSVKFLLRVLLMAIVTKSGKDITGLTWYANGQAKTYHGSQAQMFDMMFSGAPFSGDLETLKHGFDTAVANTRTPPSAFLVLGDEPSNDGLPATTPSPIFSMPIGDDPQLLQEFEVLAEMNGGKMLKMRLQ